MSSLGQLVVDMRLQSAQFIDGLKRAAAASQNTANAITSAMNLAKGAVAGLAGVLSVDFMSRSIKSAFDYADAIQDLSDRTGASTTFIQAFGYAAQLAGSSVEGSHAGLEKFSKLMGDAANGSKSAQASLEKYGIVAKTVDEGVGQASDAISKLETTQQKAAATAELFGKKNQDLTQTLSDGSSGLNTMAEEANKLGIILDESVIKNAGGANDKLDTMKMILDAQMANSILQNADALMQFADAAISAGAAAANFFSSMGVSRQMSVADGLTLNSDIPTALKGIFKGRGFGDVVKGMGTGTIGTQVQKDAQAELRKTKIGRETRFELLRDRYNKKIRSGRNKNEYDMWQDRNEMQEIAKAEAQARKPPPPKLRQSNAALNLNAGGGKSKTKGGGSKGPTGPTPAELAAEEAKRLASFMRDQRDAQGNLLSAQGALNPNATSQAAYDRLELTNDHQDRLERISSGLNKDKKGNSKYTQAEADALKALEDKTYSLRNELITQREAEAIAKDALSIKQSSIQNESDILNGDAALAKSASERRAIALRLVDLQYEQERIQLEAIKASKDSTDAEKAIATARLGILDKLKGNAVASAKEQTKGPLESYLSSIPSSAGEMTDALQSVAVDGLGSIQDGLMNAIKGTGSLADAFGSMANSIMDGLAKIAIQQMIIKPLGNLLFGGESGGGGLFGDLFKAIVPALTGKRANGGLTRPGDYLMGERGPEIVRVGATSNVVPNRALAGVAGAGRGGGMTLNFGGITSNDPSAIRRATLEAITTAMPMITSQATNATMKKLSRPRM